jgi:7,8-dihydroneopterin aldolase/epimerase/oxygenase
LGIDPGPTRKLELKVVVAVPALSASQKPDMSDPSGPSDMSNPPTLQSSPSPCRKLQPMYTVLIKGLEFYGHHGVPAEEQVIGHRYKVDIEFEVEGDTDETDDIGSTVDYGMVATQITAIAEGQRYKTVERLARVIGERLLREHTCVKRLTITLVKRLPPAPMMADEAGVRLTLER